MDHSYIPEHYTSRLNLYDTQKAIGLLKRLFEDTLCGALNLRRVSAPLFVEASSGLNDDLNGVERAVSFDIPSAGRDAQVERLEDHEDPLGQREAGRHTDRGPDEPGERGLREDGPGELAAGRADRPQ